MAHNRNLIDQNNKREIVYRISPPNSPGRYRTSGTECAREHLRGSLEIRYLPRPNAILRASKIYTSKYIFRNTKFSCVREERTRCWGGRKFIARRNADAIAPLTGEYLKTCSVA